MEMLGPLLTRPASCTVTPRGACIFTRTQEHTGFLHLSQKRLHWKIEVVDL